MFDALNVELKENYVACVHTHGKINNNIFELKFNSIQFGSHPLKSKGVNLSNSSFIPSKS